MVIKFFLYVSGDCIPLRFIPRFRVIEKCFYHAPLMQNNYRLNLSSLHT